jgi:hypothetical protein
MKKTGWAEPFRSAILKTGGLGMSILRTWGRGNLVNSGEKSTLLIPHVCAPSRKKPTLRSRNPHGEATSKPTE